VGENRYRELPRLDVMEDNPGDISMSVTGNLLLLLWSPLRAAKSNVAWQPQIIPHEEAADWFLNTLSEGVLVSMKKCRICGSMDGHNDVYSFRPELFQGCTHCCH
jgi:hypothetical protein